MNEILLHFILSILRDLLIPLVYQKISQYFNERKK